jgi:hypothetical protein
MRRTLLLVTWAVLSGCSDLPVLEDFHWGGIAGDLCPPATESEGSCGGPDCGGACVLNTPCERTSAACPAGYVCDTSYEESHGSAYCAPAALCESASECAAGEACALKELNPGICVPLDGEGEACSDGGTCEWPFDCIRGACRLVCDASGASCPAEMQCNDGVCGGT